MWSLELEACRTMEFGGGEVGRQWEPWRRFAHGEVGKHEDYGHLKYEEWGVLGFVEYEACKA